jgi:hypothetical protein
MSINKMVSKFDSSIIEFFESFNLGIREFVSYIFSLTVFPSLVFPALNLLHQIWVFIAEGYWKSFTLFQIGWELQTELIGLDKIANYVLDLPLMISLLILSTVVTLSSFLFLKIIYWCFKSSYWILREFILFWFKKDMI